ncbi:unnamed protein product [Orchesella dallaii]|uniref:Ionotropic glutamate receptor C-terminal domain-containing protein n=1 Tax=Orchesella dallaii TaxID=48710 RepID=A0ABP1S3B7_9HEXA
MLNRKFSFVMFVYRCALLVLTVNVSSGSNFLHQMHVVLCPFIDYDNSFSIFNNFVHSLLQYRFTLQNFGQCYNALAVAPEPTLESQPTIVIWITFEESRAYNISSEFWKSILHYKEIENKYSLLQIHHTLLIPNCADANFCIEELASEIANHLQANNELFLCDFGSTNGAYVNFKECFELYWIKTRVVITRIFFPMEASSDDHNDDGTLIFFEHAIYEIGIRRVDFLQETLPGVALDLPGLVSTRFKPKLKPDDPLEFEGGSNVEEYRYLKDALNFKEKAASSNQSMKQLPDETLKNSGFVEMLNSGEADFSLGQYEFIAYRMRGSHGIRYLHSPTTKVKGLAIFVQPLNREVRNFYGRPFRMVVWLLVILTLGVFLIALWILLKFENNAIHEQLRCKPTLRKGKLMDSEFWLIIASIVTLRGNVSNLSRTVTTSTKVAIFAAHLCSFTIIGIYTSNLTSILTLDVDAIQNFDQLIQLKYIFFVNQFSPSLKIVLQQSNKEVVEVAIEKAFEQVLNSKTAILTGSQEFQTITPLYKNDYLCNKLSLIELNTLPIKNAHVVKQGSPFRNAFNIK